MTRFVGAVLAALVAFTATLTGQGVQTATERLTPQGQAAARNLVQDVKTVGCIRLWKPAPDDPAKAPPDRQPGLAGIYLLTPVAASPTTVSDMPTYLLTPSGTINFSQHVGHKVEISGLMQPAPLPSTVQEAVTAPTMRPEERPSTNGMPRLTVSTLTKVGESCP